MAAPSFPITGDTDADHLLITDPLALVIGMLLDQQVPMEWAFRGPATLESRLGDRFDATAIAAMDLDDFIAVCREKPAIHRFPKSMGQRIHELCAHVADHYDGDPRRVWTDAESGQDLYQRVRDLPGFGDEKSKIFIALLAKRFDITPDGWEKAAGPFSDTTPRSAADVDSEESLQRVREWKRAQKAAKKSKQD
jgi:uncharacterized HhH-GPD family protein